VKEDAARGQRKRTDHSTKWLAGRLRPKGRGQAGGSCCQGLTLVRILGREGSHYWGPGRKASRRGRKFLPALGKDNLLDRRIVALREKSKKVPSGQTGGVPRKGRFGDFISVQGFRSSA